MKTLRSGTLPGDVNPVLRGAPERRSHLIDVKERRVAPASFEMRAVRAGDLVATGYASTFEEYEVYGGPENYGWIEAIDRRAFNKTLRDKPDVVFLINHTGLPLARTKSGTLKLKVDDGGLAPEALLEKTDPDVLALQPKVARGDVDEMSFAFYVKAQEWSAAEGFEDDPFSYRLITELSLNRGDVSVVTFGANPTTSFELGTVGADGSLSADGGRERIVLAGGPQGRSPVAYERDGVIGVGMNLAEAKAHHDALISMRAGEVYDFTGDLVATLRDGGNPAEGEPTGDDPADTPTGDGPPATDPAEVPPTTSIADARAGLPDIEPQPRCAHGKLRAERCLLCCEHGVRQDLDCADCIAKITTMSVADARAQAGLVQSVQAARTSDHPSGDTPPATLSLADARASE